MGAFLTTETKQELVDFVNELEEAKEQYDDIHSIAEKTALCGLCDYATAKEAVTTEMKRNLNYSLKEYQAIGTIEEFKALKEKNTAKKPNQVSKAMDKDKYVGLIGRCPNCGSIVAEDNLVCEDCFQVLDWSE